MNAVTDTCPPLEDLAAFLDGKLSEGERARVVAHLADCESCYAVFAGAARFQLEEEEEELPMPEAAAATAAPVVPFPQKKMIPRWALPLAALLVLGLATIPLYQQQYSRMPTLLSTELVDPAALKSVPTGSLWAEDMRGGPESVVLDASPFEFLLGAHLVDLRLTLARNDRAESLNMLSRINGHMKNLILADDEARFYLRALGEVSQGKPLSDLAEEAARVEASLTKSYEEFPHLAFGKWTEAGRLSALAGNSAFFEDKDNQRFPNWLLRNAEEDLGEEIVPTLKRIRGILEDGDPSKLPYEILENQFEAILKHYQREADAASSL
jgi:DNA-binding phage protein